MLTLAPTLLQVSQIGEVTPKAPCWNQYGSPDEALVAPIGPSRIRRGFAIPGDCVDIV
jgi:hypothetical protein